MSSYSPDFLRRIIDAPAPEEIPEIIARDPMARFLIVEAYQAGRADRLHGTTGQPPRIPNLTFTEQIIQKDAYNNGRTGKTNPF